MTDAAAAGRPHPAIIDEQTLLAQCECRRQRRSGPGGQHRNKVETGIFLKHRATGIEAVATERRSQNENRRVALQRLRMAMAMMIRQEVADTENASPLWKSRLTGGQINVSRNHVDFVALLAEALDFLAAENWDHIAAARRLCCSPSQLVKLFRKEPRVLADVNKHRTARGFVKLR